FAFISLLPLADARGEWSSRSVIRLVIIFGDPSARLGVAKADLVHEGLAGARSLESLASREPQASLEQDDRTPRLVGDPGGELHRLRLDLRARVHAVEQTRGQGFALEVLTAEHHLGRLVLADGELKQPRRPHAGREAKRSEARRVGNAVW